MKWLRTDWFPVLLGLVILIVIVSSLLNSSPRYRPVLPLSANNSTVSGKVIWKPPNINSLPDDEAGKLIRYGRELISNTSKYLGPKGSIAALTNGMNCQNCHTDGGTRNFEGCLSGVASLYPQFRPRSGIIESIEFRISDCMLRSLNGKSIDSNSREMKAMVAYLEWLGKDVPKKIKPIGAGTEELPFLQRAADTSKGRLVYEAKCITCHGKDGAGVFNADSSGYFYPPLWGPHSYNTGAGLYRLSRFSGYVKNSMPFGTVSHERPLLTTEEAWDVAAFVNSQPRPHKEFNSDWPDLDKKGFDYPFGPYTDGFTESQHKYGPFEPIIKAKEAKQKK